MYSRRHIHRVVYPGTVGRHIHRMVYPGTVERHIWEVYPRWCIPGCVYGGIP